MCIWYCEQSRSYSAKLQLDAIGTRGVDRLCDVVWLSHRTWSMHTRARVDIQSYLAEESTIVTSISQQSAVDIALKLKIAGQTLYRKESSMLHSLLLVY